MELSPFSVAGRDCFPGIGQDGGVATILVVEDERDIRDLLRRYLERAGHSVLTSGTGAEALRLLEDGSTDLVLLDLGLPDVDGFDVLRLATTLGVSVIALTARSSAIRSCSRRSRLTSVRNRVAVSASSSKACRSRRGSSNAPAVR